MGVSTGGLAKGEPGLRTMLRARLDPLRQRGLGAVLSGAASAARDLLDCEYTAVLVRGADNRLEHFVPVGTAPDAVELVGRLPQQLGILGEVAGEGRVVRSADIRTDSRYVGLPDHHPPVTALLGIPIVTRGRCVGGLFLARPRRNENFDDDDQRAAEVVAAAIADELEADRTELENFRREAWHEAGAELARELAAGRHAHPQDFLVDQVRHIADAGRVLLVQPRGDTVTVAAAAGLGANAWRGVTVPADRSFSAEVLASGRPMTVLRLDESSRIEGELRQRFERPSSALLVPILPGYALAAVLVLVRVGEGRVFTAAESGMAAMLAGQVALALDVASLRGRRDESQLIAERNRIARDLHDHVIQRLFALGMSLQTASLTLPEPVERRLQDGVDEIDDTIRQIRATIYQLTGPITSEQVSLRSRVSRLMEELEPALGFRPRLVVSGPVDLGVDDDAIIEDSLAVLREALTNVVRHARATEVTVSLDAGTELTVEIADNGRGMGESTRRSGLANMRARAEEHGGSLAIAAVEPHGTVLRWTIPL